MKRNANDIETVPQRRQRRRSAPRSGATPSLDDGEETAAEEHVTPFEGDAGDPPKAPALPFTAYPPKRELYEEAFRAAYKYPDTLMLVMEGVRKGLKRGKKAARRAGGQLE